MIVAYNKVTEKVVVCTSVQCISDDIGCSRQHLSRLLNSIVGNIHIGDWTIVRDVELTKVNRGGLRKGGFGYVGEIKL